MVFSSVIFLFVFLPLCVAGSFICPMRFRNIFLLIASVAFYAWGEPKFVFVVFAGTLVNWALGLAADKYSKKMLGKAAVAIAVAFDISVLLIFKYLGFIDVNVERFLGVNLNLPSFVLPIGISFYTFQAISYVIDVYRKKSSAQLNPLNTMLYIMLFPQLIAGPIVRYEDIAEQLTNRSFMLDDFTYGLKRFIIGLAKKTLLANAFAIYADGAFGGLANNPVVAWGGVLAYTLQIFFDFSAYSDMAIGLGKMFGFDFLENFNYPYIASSVTDFWRRWHISLGSWFRDYVYFPLGGSRVKSKFRLVFNLFIVWVLTGIWHGAHWQFIAWGLLYFVLLTFEKLLDIPKKLKTVQRWQTVLYRVFTLFTVMFGWVLFRANGLMESLRYLYSLIGMQISLNGDVIKFTRITEFSVSIIDFCWLLGTMIAGVLFATPLMKIAGEKLSVKVGKFGIILEYIVTLFLFILSAASIIASSYNPFIYFNF